MPADVTRAQQRMDWSTRIRGPVVRARSAFQSGPLASHNFRLLNAGQITSTLGDYCYAVALPWLVLAAHGSVVLLGLVLACYGVPRTVLMPVGGMLADKVGARTVMIAVDVFRAVLVCVLAYFGARHFASIEALGPVAALMGAGSALFLPASYSIVPGLLAPSQLQAGNAIYTAGIQVGTLAGPALGGILVATVGSAAAFGVDAASFVVSAVTLLLFRSDPAVAGATADSPAGDVTAPAGRQAEGRASGEDKRGKPRLAPLLREPVLISMLIVTLIANFVVAGAFEVALPNLAHLRFGPGGYGALLTCFGAGAVVGTLYAARARPMRMPAVIACCTFIVAGLAVAVIPYAGGLPGAAAGMAAMAAFSSFGNIILITLLQQWAPRELIGRVMGLVMTASAGCYPIAVAMGGLLVHRFGPAPFFPAAGAGLVLAVIGALSRREIRTLGAQVAQLPAQAAAA